MHWIDSHCHLDMLDLAHFDNNFDKLINFLQQQGLVHLLWVCIDFNHFKSILEKSLAYDWISISVGTHPNELESKMPDLSTLIEQAKHPKVVAIGETGLDYFRTPEQSIATQQHQFRLQIQAARAVNKPIIIHTRQAKIDTLSILKEEKAEEVGGVFHCFTEDWDMAKQAIDMNFAVSFSGIVTFKNAHELKEVAKKLPLSSLLIETDSPYLTPSPYRGKPNHPGMVKLVGEYIAQLRGISIEEIAHITQENFHRVFPAARYA